ncbi:MAG: N-6 DNA methylase, partial [Deltaproteobacteria bacterium]|nr:N-6 DNA methylase [Deltaproteobacteria bacterium]
MPNQTKQYWQINTKTMAERIRTAAQSAKTEEDLKMALEPIFKKAYEDIGVNVDIVQYEKSTALKAQMDAVYGHLIIEYKRPGKLKASRDIKKAELQLQKYLTEESLSHKPNNEQFLEKAVGMAIDGHRILFVRYSRTQRVISTPIPIEDPQKKLFPTRPVAVGFCRLGPYDIKEDSLANLLIFVRAAARRPLTAEDLARVFGPDNPLARQAVSEIYSAAMRSQRLSKSSRTKTFYKEWDRIFGVVYGQELKKAEKEAAETAGLYGMPGGVRLKQLLFSIHTYYAFLMKVIAIELLALQKDQAVISFVKDLGNLDDEQLKNRLSHLESGLDFNERGITNFLEADFFRWYLDAWSPALANVFRNIARSMAEFEPTTPILEPEWTIDLLKKLYELIVPKKLRHDLGEYYTPDWLAQHLIQKSGYDGDVSTRLLDPACGSGTFLIQAIQMVKDKMFSKKRVEMGKVGQEILNNIVGFDLNPLAVLAARTNYLIAFSPFIPYVRPISIPVFLCDSVLTPTTYVRSGGWKMNQVVFKTTRADYFFPLSMQDKEGIDRFTGLVDLAIQARYDTPGFSKLLRKMMPAPEKDYDLLVKVFEQIAELERKGENGIWARYIKNAFAPVYMGKFDYVLGNPPWIRWGYLSDHYRKRTLDLWKGYGLFSLTGHETRLGGGEKDFSMLFTYACVDNYLDEGGILGFVITIEAFKSKGAGEGFRGFELADEKMPLKMLGMEDMVDLKPFQAANKTSVFTMKKGTKTSYPVPVIQWKRKPGRGSIPMEWDLDQVKDSITRHSLDAIPVDPKKISSSWQTMDKASYPVLEKVKGTNPYKAHLGARVEPYGVFWLQIKEVRPDGLLVVSNMH